MPFGETVGRREARNRIECTVCDSSLVLLLVKVCLLQLRVWNLRVKFTGRT